MRCSFANLHLTYWHSFPVLIQIITRYSKVVTSTTNDMHKWHRHKLWKDKATNDIIYNNWQIYTSPLAMQALIHAPQHSPKVLHFASCNTNIMTSTANMHCFTNSWISGQPGSESLEVGDLFSRVHESRRPFQLLIYSYSSTHESWSLPVSRSTQEAFHDIDFEDFNNKPRAEEHVALTLASDDLLILPTNVPNT